MSIQRYYLNPRMSRIVVHNGIAYFSGLVAEDLTQDFAGQTRQILERIEQLLVEVGSHKSRLLQALVWVSDMQRISEVNRAWEAWIDPQNPPVRAAVQAGFRSAQHKVEIMVTAAV